MTTVLSPGSYWLELAFARPVTKPVLEQALSSMGFANVTFDATAVSPAEIGALSRSLASASTSSSVAKKPVATTAAPAPIATAAPSRSVASASVTATPAPPPAVLAVTPVAAPIAAPAPSLDRSALSASSNVSQIAPPPAAAPSPVLDRSAASVTSNVSQVKPVLSRSVQSARANVSQVKPTVPMQRAMSQPFTPGLNRGTLSARANVSQTKPLDRGTLSARANVSQVKPIATPTPAASASAVNRSAASAAANVSQVKPPSTKPALGKKNVPASAQAPSEEPAYEGGGGESSSWDGYGGGGGGGGIYDEAPPAEETYAAASEELGPDVVELWWRWVEWGSPFAAGPPSVSGDDPGGPYRYRVLATLTKAIRIFDRPGMRWLYVRKLGTNPFGELDFTLKPLPLEEGQTYELRFLARVKSMPTREAVRAGLASMGFAPLKLATMKENVRIPGRPGASLTLWYALGRWDKPTTVVTVADPFFFLNAEAVSS